MRNGSNSYRKEQVLDAYASELGVHLILGGAISPALDAPGQFNQLPVERRREIAAQALGEVLPRARAADGLLETSKSVRPAGGRKFTPDTIAHMHKVLDAVIDAKLQADSKHSHQERLQSNHSQVFGAAPITSADEEVSAHSAQEPLPEEGPLSLSDSELMPVNEQAEPASWTARHQTPGAGPAMDAGWMSDAERFARDAAGCVE